MGVEVDEDCFERTIRLPLGVHQLEGWYGVYIGLYDPGSLHQQFNEVGIEVKAADDLSFTNVRMYQVLEKHSPLIAPKRGFVRERHFKRVEMDGQDLHFHQDTRLDAWRPPGVYKLDIKEFNVRGGVAWVRLESADQPPGRATEKPNSPILVSYFDAWDQITIDRATDEGALRDMVQWMQTEPYNVLRLDANSSIDKTSYATKVGEPGDRYEVTMRRVDQIGIECRRTLTAKGVNCLAVWADQASRMGMETWTYLRMGAWQMPAPWGGHSGRLYREHPEWRLLLKDGTPTDKLSYAFPEVRQYVVDLFREQIQFC